MVSIQACDGDLCDELQSGVISTFTHTYRGDPPDREVAAVHGFRLIVDLSPLTVGHLLLLPEAHYLSFGHLDDAQLERVRGITTSLRAKYVATFGQMAVLEHGSSSEIPSACVTHAHWHILPVEGSRVADLMIRDGLAAVRLSDFTDLKQFAAADQPYYYCYDGANHLVFDAQRRIRSQYLRSVVGAHLGIPEPEWDWSVVVRKDLLRETMTATRGWREYLSRGLAETTAPT